MRLNRLFLRNVRCYEEALFNFSPECNLIWGPNAHGKTTILEVIFLLISGRSFRTPYLRELIREGKDYFYLEALFETHGVQHQVTYLFSENERQLRVNQTVYPSLMSLLGTICGVASTPEDLTLIKGAPEVRRSYLDLQLSQVNPLYLYHLQRYQRALKQRNQLLRSRQPATIDCWEKALSQAAYYIVNERKQLLEHLNPLVTSAVYDVVGEKEELSLQYKSSFSTAKSEEEILQRYYRTRSRELELGFTLVGPHRDDLIIHLEGREARSFSSEGQQRTVALALRTAEWVQMHRQMDELPLTLLDEAGIGLDAERRRKLLLQVSQRGQLFLTATEDFQGILPQEKTERINVQEHALQSS